MRTACLLFAGLLVAADVRAQALLHDAPAASAVPAGAAAAVPGATAVFRSSVDLVALNVVVTDRASKFITGLKQTDFAVFEDGVQQDVSFFAASSVPLDLAILLDTSASMTDKMREVQQAAVGFASTLRDGDRVMIVDIKDATKVLQPLTGDLEAATAAIASTKAKGGTALLNGVYLTLKELTKQRKANEEIRRQAIVVLSDGDDTASLVSFDDVMAEAKAAGIAIYTITLRSQYLVNMAAARGRRYFAQSEYSMKALAQETGARSFFPSSITELAGVYGSIADELASQYALGYTSKNPRRDGAFRRVTVRLAEPGATLRTRSGYLGPRAERKLGTN